MKKTKLLLISFIISTQVLNAQSSNGPTKDETIGWINNYASDFLNKGNHKGGTWADGKERQSYIKANENTGTLLISMIFNYMETSTEISLANIRTMKNIKSGDVYSIEFEGKGVCKTHSPSGENFTT
ncbi:hypothetical protein [Gaetbulibacter aestuarii]|uniref:Uncharacterized protein n=1 Tax=Gaetbulibacter aestuarii TaxID=1502358 RepID=A0ABW7MVI4_9FLAO